MGLISDIDLEKLEQKLIDLVFIQVEKLIEKIEKIDGTIDGKFQSMECSFVALQSTLNEMLLTFLHGQEERHKEITRICNIINNHENRIMKLEKSNDESIALGVY